MTLLHGGCSVKQHSGLPAPVGGHLGLSEKMWQPPSVVMSHWQRRSDLFAVTEILCRTSPNWSVRSSVYIIQAWHETQVYII